jgi:hypothetical protein
MDDLMSLVHMMTIIRRANTSLACGVGLVIGDLIVYLYRERSHCSAGPFTGDSREHTDGADGYLFGELGHPICFPGL